MRFAKCGECGAFMNCGEIDAAHDETRNTWTCGPCVRQYPSDVEADEGPPMRAVEFEVMTLTQSTCATCDRWPTVKIRLIGAGLPYRLACAEHVDDIKRDLVRLHDWEMRRDEYRSPQ